MNTKSSKEFWQSAEGRAFQINRTFLDMQASDHPLTAEEIRKLAAKRPEIWGRFLKYAENMKG